MLNVNNSSKFKKDLKRCAKRGYDLKGNYKGHRECHITPDWLLIYEIDENDLYLDRTGTHSDLFDE